MRVKPVDPNAVIRDPHTKRRLPAEGGKVPDTGFWRRRLADGVIVVIAEPVAPVAKPAAPSARTPSSAAAPIGNEPLSPLTTRDLKKG